MAKHPPSPPGIVVSKVPTPQSPSSEVQVTLLHRECEKEEPNCAATESEMCKHKTQLIDFFTCNAKKKKRLETTFLKVFIH